jgi:putative ABC transport system ATP-binding protein/lipoprotein-releasing system ATP-binding protein
MSAIADEPVARCIGVARTYGKGAAATVALQPTDCEIAPDARLALMGSSGSGKSTLLHLLAGLDTPTLGTVEWPAIGDRDHLRPGPIAVIFQGPSLMAPLTVVENVALPLVLGGSAYRDAHDAALSALELVGLADIVDHLPDEISGGQAQRAAVARALAGNPKLIVADEPTGQLDRDNAAAVVEVLVEAAERADAALVVATHDPLVAAHLAETWELHDGRLTANSSIREF